MSPASIIGNPKSDQPVRDAPEEPIAGELSTAMASTMMPESDVIARTLVDNVQEGVYFVDTERRIQYWNAAAENISGYKSSEVAGKCCGDNILCHIDKEGNSLCRGMCPLAATIKDGEPRTVDVFLHHKDGHRVPVRASVAQLRDGNGKVIGGLEVFESLARQMAVIAEVPEDELDALIDPVTGAANRKYSETVLGHKMEDAKRRKKPLGVLFIEIDGFSAILEGANSKVGDLVLKIVGKTLVGGMRACDVVGRWTGSGFLAILPGLSSAQLALTADQIRVRVQKSSYSITKGKIGVTVSIGVGMCRASDTTDTIDQLACRSMAKASDGMRNCVVTLE